MIGLNPNAAVTIYNYIDRQGFYRLEENLRDEVEVIELRSEIVSISTQKQKSQPSGSFEIILAPTRNWTTSLTPGSWLSIHMSPYDNSDLLSFSPKTLKMVGRIDTVQMSVSVSQETGARQTLFVVRGRDWGQVFESTLYIDPMASLSGDSALEQILRFGFDSKLANQGGKLFTSSGTMKFFIDVWGEQGQGFKSFKEQATENIKSLDGKISADRLFPSSVYFLPKELTAAFIGTKTMSVGSNTLAENIALIPGRLKGYDEYEDKKEIGGPINTGAIVGGNSLWQILNAHCGSVVNELVTDFRWIGENLQLALYKRVRPFLVRNNADAGPVSPHADSISSLFINIKRTEIDADRVMAIQAGTNWRDKFNFVEVLPQLGSTVADWKPIETLVKTEGCAAYDPVSFGRDGFKPLLFYTPYMPFKEDGSPAQAEAVKQWIPVIRDWYFDTHKMLNGTVRISNQEDYIGVGENIAIDGYMFTSSYHIDGDSDRGNNIKLLAHVESVDNTFAVDENGTRTFYTTVTFVRGVFTDGKYKDLFTDLSFGIDSDASKLSKDQELLTNVYEVKEK